MNYPLKITTKALSDYLYIYLHGDDKDMPEDEYDTEADIIISRLNKEQPMSALGAARIVAETLSESLEYSYSVEDFIEAGEYVAKHN